MVVSLNLRFGTSLSGLVVPGYLVPILLIKPISGAIIIVEAIITYLLATGLSRCLVKYNLACELFGRDRFFALVLISVIVRLALDGYILPEIGEAIIAQGIQFDYRNHLHSFGLIIVSLIANQLWNANFKRGIQSTLLTIGITYLVIRYGLMTCTNFEISNLSYLYEDLASSILASPKAYIILILSAFIASRMNLAYGWEYNGILIPSLLALQWYQPEKLLATFLEAFIILFVGKWMLNRRMLRYANIEGGRLLLLFFNIGFVYKLALAYAILYFYPTSKITDHYGFGYLLSTLIALKIYQKDIFARLTRATLQTSAVAAILATFVGFALTLIPSPFATSTITPTDHQKPIGLLNKTLLQYMPQLRSRLYASTITRQYTLPTTGELYQFETGLQLLLTLTGSQDHLNRPSNEPLDDTLGKALDKPTDEPIDAPLEAHNDRTLKRAQHHFFLAGFEVLKLQEGLISIQEIDNKRGWGNLIINPNANSKLLISVPAPLDESTALDIAPWIFSSQNAKALVIHGSKLDRDVNGRSNVLTNANTIFHKAHQVMGHRNVLQVRSYSKTLARDLYAGVNLQGTPIPTDLPHQLFIKRTLPTDLTLKPFGNTVGELPTHWATLPTRSLQREESFEGFAELVIDRAGARQMLKSSVLQNPITTNRGLEKIDGYLTQRLFSEKVNIAPKGSNAYKPAALSELVYIDQEILRPMLRLAQSIQTENTISDNPIYQLQLAELNMKASAVGYEINLYQHVLTKKQYLIFQELSSTPQKHWGLLVIKLGKSKPFIIEVPRPLAERQTYEFGATLFEAVDARIIAFSGSHPDANHSGSSDVLRLLHKHSLFNLAHQTSLTLMQANDPLVLQIRGFSPRQHHGAPQANLLIAFWEGLPRAPSSDIYQTLKQVIHAQGIDYQMVDGDLNTVGFEAAYNAQTGFLAAVEQADLAVLWLSQNFRRQFTDKALWQTKIFDTLFIKTRATDLAHELAEHNWHPNGCALRNRLIDRFQHWKDTQNIHSLYDAIEQLPEYQINRLIDKDTLQGFLVVSEQLPSPSEKGRVFFIINLNSQADAPNLTDEQSTIQLKMMREHLKTRAGSLCGAPI